MPKFDPIEYFRSKIEKHEPKLFIHEEYSTPKVLVVSGDKHRQHSVALGTSGVEDKQYADSRFENAVETLVEGLKKTGVTL
jgi:hypothetical protein